MKFIATILFVTLTAIAALHAYWGFGGLWPASSEVALIETVVGVPGMTEMFSPEITLVVAVLIFMAGLFALLATDIVKLGPLWFAKLATAVLTIIFIGRGILGYVTPARGIPMTEPFATYDIYFYSPLCLLLGLGFLLITFGRAKKA